MSDKTIFTRLNRTKIEVRIRKSEDSPKLDVTNRHADRFGRLAQACLCFAFFALMPNCSSGAEVADGWLEDPAAVHPGVTLPGKPESAAFASLRAEVLVGKLKLQCDGASSNRPIGLTAVVSYDAPGQWLARDWKRFPMTLRGSKFEATLPVENLDVPIVYFVETVGSEKTRVSPLRMCNARLLGMDVPSRLPWAFLEGFEQGLEGWELVGEDFSGAKISASSLAHDGDHSLGILLPAGKHSVTVATSRVRAWKIRQHTAIGVRLWLRANKGSGRARFTITANARSEHQAITVYPDEPVVTPGWSVVELPLSRIPEVSLPEVNLLTIEFIGVGPAEFLIDDLELIEPLQATPAAQK